MSFEIAICSAGRADLIGTLTLHALSEAGISSDLVTLFVPEPELAPYERHGRAGAVPQPLAPSRRAAALHYPEGAPVVWLDDDVEAFVTPESTSLAECFDEAFKRTSGIWGLAQMPHRRRIPAGAISGTPRMNPPLISGWCDGAPNTHEDWAQCQLDDMEDLERTLRWRAAGRDLALIPWLYAVHRSHRWPSGLQSVRTPALREAAMDYLAAQWPRLVAIRRFGDGPRYIVQL